MNLLDLKLILEPLPPSLEKSLRLWLGQSELNLLLDVLKSRAREKEFECAESRFQSDIYPAYELQAKAAAKDADQLRHMVSTLTEMRKQPDSEPFTIAVPEITPTNL